MVNIPAKAKTRIIAGVKKFKPILTKALNKDINESDTVTIIGDMLSDIFGYDKYSEITSEYVVKKTFCDLAVELNDKVAFLIEAKAIGANLKDDFVKQAVDYGANAGIEWVALTNGIVWRVYRIVFAQPISQELIYEFDICEIDTKKQIDLEQLFYLCREAMIKSSKLSLADYCEQKQILNKFTISQLLLNDIVLDTIRKTLKKMAPDAKTSNEEIYAILSEEIIKRDALDGEKAIEAKKRIAKYLRSIERKKKETKVEPVENK